MSLKNLSVIIKIPNILKDKLKNKKIKDYCNIIEKSKKIMDAKPIADNTNRVTLKII